jgi:site-specific DNA recombinase
MIVAAIYARKSTDQVGVSDENRSVARQVEHAKAYAARKGWAVAETHVYSDDGISGAEFVKRPGFLRLMNALKPRPPFQVLIMSEESRLGREQIETAYALKQIMDAGARVFFYLEDRERTLDNALDKVMLSLANFAAEMEREKARQRTHDAMLRKAKAQQVAGGKVYGYDNKDVFSPLPGPDGASQRLHVIRVINEAQAEVVRRIFELYASGLGIVKVAKLLNAERVPSPRGDGWAPTAIREMLHRELYRGEVVWNKTQRMERAGTKKKRARDEKEWVHLDAPELRIVPNELWQRVHARVETNQQAYSRRAQGQLEGRPVPMGFDSPYLLGGFLKCAVCGGSLIPTSRSGRGGRKTYYRCSMNWKRGASICDNATSIPTGALDSAILHALSDVLDERVLARSVDKALAKLRAGTGGHDDRRSRIERELALIESRLGRLLKAIMEGGPLDTLVAQVKTEEQRKTTLAAELGGLQAVTKVSTLDSARLKRSLAERLAGTKALLTRNTPQARRMLKELLEDRIAVQPVEQAGSRTVRFTGKGSFGGLLSGEAAPLMVVPPG